MNKYRLVGQRHGGVLVLVVMLVFVLLAIAGLLIDIGMARLTQAHMQSVGDAAALEGGWQMAMGADETAVRDAVVRRAEEMSENWGPKRIELEDGFDLDNDGIAESSQAINRETICDSIRPTLDPNIDNELAGDVVIGLYDANAVPETLPGQPLGYDRGAAFAPNVDAADAVLVRLRRTDEGDIAGGTSAERLSYLWSRGSLLDLGLKGQGIAVRSETIAQLAPVVAIGDAIDELIPTVLSAAIPLTEVVNETFSRASLMPTNEARTIGDAVGSEPGVAIIGVGYLPIARLMSSGQWQVVGFMFAQITETEIVPTTPSDHGFTIVNATSNLASISGLNDELIRANQELSGSHIAHAPKLVRSQQIRGVSP